MPNGENSWDIGYSEIMFFANALNAHQAVDNFTRTEDIVFDISRLGMSPLRVVLVSEYRLGEAAAYRAIQEFPGIQAIVNSGNWNAVALDRNSFRRQTKVEVLSLKNFLGALNDPDFCA